MVDERNINAWRQIFQHAQEKYEQKRWVVGVGGEGCKIKSSGTKGIGSVTCQFRLPISSITSSLESWLIHFIQFIFANGAKNFHLLRKIQIPPPCFCYTKMLTSKDIAPTQAKNTLQQVLKAPRAFLNRTTLRICKLKNNQNNNMIYREVELYIHNIKKTAYYKKMHNNCDG